MQEVLTILCVLVFAFWALLALDWKRWWPSSLRLRGGPNPEPPAGDAGVIVVIPARDEAEALPLTLPSVLEQGDIFSMLVLVDDGSTDGTRDVASRLVSVCPWAEKVRVVSGSPAPPGWSGKLNALQTGLGAANHREGGADRWLLFTDADIKHPPGSVKWLLARAREGPHDLVSVMARLRCESFWEKLLVPPFVYFFQLMYPFRRVGDPRSGVAAAAGGCILVRESTFRRIGGFEEIRSAVIDDVTLASRLKGAGARCWLGTDPDMVSVRAYGTFGELARMVSRTAFTQLKHSLCLLAATLAFLLVFFVAPPFLAAAQLAVTQLGGAHLEDRGAVPGLLALGACFLQAATLFPVVRHQRAGPLFCLTLPVASLAYAWMTFRSAWLYFKARGVEWKGRTVS